MGCSRSNPGPEQKKANPDNNKQETISWEIQLDSKCNESVEASQCVAGYGFAITNDGKFKLGLGPNGESRPGNLSAEDRNLLEKALGNNLTATRLQEEGHQTIGALETEDKITLTYSSNTPEILIKAAGTDLTYRLQTADDAKVLYDTLRTLAAKYYSLPFPGCDDKVNLVQTMITAAQACNTAADCTYVDDSFEAVDFNSGSFMATDSCEKVMPMVAGNTKAVSEAKARLQELLADTQQTCGCDYNRPDCSATGTNLSAAPVCEQGMCRISASASQPPTGMRR